MCKPTAVPWQVKALHDVPYRVMARPMETTMTRHETYHQSMYPTPPEVLAEEGERLEQGRGVNTKLCE